MATTTSASGFPDATTAGVPEGTTLKASGSIVVNTPGAVIEGLDINGTVTINAPNVTLKDNKISSGSFDTVSVKGGVTGTVIENNDIDNQNSGGQGIAGQGTIINNNIHNAADGIDVRGPNTLIQGNYIHDLGGTAGSHFDGIQASGGITNLTINHNTVINDHGQTSALLVSNDFGGSNDVKITDNLLVGGGYTTYLTEGKNSSPGPAGPLTNVTYTGNHIGAGVFGPLDLVSDFGDKPTIANNVDDGKTLEAKLVTTGQPAAGSDTPVAGTPPTDPTTGSGSTSPTDGSGSQAGSGSTTNPTDPTTGSGTTSPTNPTTGSGSTSPTDGSGSQAGSGSTTNPTDPATGSGTTSPTNPTTGSGSTSPTDPTTGSGSTSPTDGSGSQAGSGSTTNPTDPTTGSGSGTTPPTTGSGSSGSDPSDPTTGSGKPPVTSPTGSHGHHHASHQHQASNQHHGWNSHDWGHGSSSQTSQGGDHTGVSAGNTSGTSGGHPSTAAQCALLNQFLAGDTGKGVGEMTPTASTTAQHNEMMLAQSHA